ncbi:MAG: hypothetical protein WC549_04625 [Actinomycetota bacterium]
MSKELNKILNRQSAKMIFFGREYDVLFNTKLLKVKENGTTAWAEAQPAFKRIVFAEDIPDDFIFSTLIHEIIETINWSFDMGLDHCKITTLETSICAILMDNKLIK